MANETVTIPLDLFTEIYEYFDSRKDVTGDSEHLQPNKEMQIISELDNYIN